MCISNDDAQNYLFCGEQLNQPIKIQQKSPKLLIQRIKKTLIENFGD